MKHVGHSTGLLVHGLAIDPLQIYRTPGKLEDRFSFANSLIHVAAAWLCNSTQ